MEYRRDLQAIPFKLNRLITQLQPPPEIQGMLSIPQVPLMLRHFVFVLLGGVQSLVAFSASTPDFAREERIRAEIVDVILDGDAIDLSTTDGRSFLGLYTQQTVDKTAMGTVVILHSRGLHPDWATVIHPLRVGLPAAGWHTLSIQLPVLDKTASYYDYVPVFPAAVPRIEAAIAEARSREPDAPIVLLAHSCGYHMAQHWIGTKGSEAIDSIDAFVGIGMGAIDYGQRMVEPFVLDRVTVPTLDLYGSRDYPAVRRLAPERLNLMRQTGQAKSGQVIVPGADHYFSGRSEALVDAVVDWLEGL